MNLVDKLAQEYLLKTSSLSRYCGIYKAKNGKWYMDLADDEYGEWKDAVTYGPFPNEDRAVKYLDNFSNPGGWVTDFSGEAEVPTRSPNGRPVQRPRSGGGMGGGYGGYGRRRGW